MLFLAFVLCTWLAGRRAQMIGISRDLMLDLCLWMFIGGLIGARIVFMWQEGLPLWEFYKIWNGGIVFYGSLLGGFLGYALGYRYYSRRQTLGWWRLADVVAPSLALGLCLGRIGCFLNGCCYGNVACPDAHCPAVHFPMSAMPRYDYARHGFQTAAGFTTLDAEHQDGRTVVWVEPESAADMSKLQAGDVLDKVQSSADKAQGRSGEFTAAGQVKVTTEAGTNFYYDLRDYLFREWIAEKPGRKERPATVDVVLTVQRSGKPVELPALSVATAEDPTKLDFGFAVAGPVVGEVEPDSAAAQHGLRHGDLIVRADDRPISFANDLDRYLANADEWPRGKNDLTLSVVHNGQKIATTLAAFSPRTIGLHPTQLYETISMALLFLLLLAFEPFRRREGQLIALFFVCYPIHRFLNEMLRNDTQPVAFNMTLSQNGSIVVILIGVLMFLGLGRRPATSPVRASQKP